jgi:hypothetical protein
MVPITTQTGSAHAQMCKYCLKVRDAFVFHILLSFEGGLVKNRTSQN